MSASIGAASSRPRPEPIGTTYWRLRRMGFAGAEAANLAALSKGFAITAQPWTIHEVTHLLFIQELSAGQQWSGNDDRADAEAPAAASALTAIACDPSADYSGGTVRGVRWLHVEGTDPGDGRITLLTMFRAVLGRDAPQHVLPPFVQSLTDAASDVSGDGR